MNRTRWSWMVGLVCGMACTLSAAETGVGKVSSSAESEKPVAKEPEAPKVDPEVASIYHADDLIVVTATRTEENWFDVPFVTDVVEPNVFVGNRQYRTMPDALSDIPSVQIQKTSNGQGSPYIRGFTGYHTLLMVDGVRINNSTWRSGPNQYFSLIDPYTIDRLEVIKGPSSVLYGSDAIGGTVNVITQSRESFLPGFNVTPSAEYRFATADHSHVGRLQMTGNMDEWLGFVVGGTGSWFNDVHGGGGVGRMKKTGYELYNGDVKFQFQLDPNRQITFAYFQTDKNDAWRSHKTTYGFSWEGTTVGSEDKRVLDEDYSLMYLKYDETEIGSFIDEFHATFSWQTLRERRSRTRYSKSRPFDEQSIDMDTFGLDLQFVTPTPVGPITYGVDWYHDVVNSWKHEYDINGQLVRRSVQGPVADDATYDLLGVYVQNEIALGDRLTVWLGGRYNHAQANANRVADPFDRSKVNSIDENYDALVGSARFALLLDEEEHWMAFGGVSQGFRAPNLSDLTRFDTARSDEIETPTRDLDPERFISYEIGVKVEYETLTAQASYYWTTIDNMIIRAPTGRMIDGAYEVTKKNAGKGYVNGVDLSIAWRFHPEWTAFGSFSWMYGAVGQYPTSSAQTSREPLSRLMPPTGQFGLRWVNPTDTLWAEVVCTAAGHQDHYPTRDARDTQRIPPGGTPGWFTVDVRGGWRPFDGLEIWAGLENATNESYRIVGSGVNEPGINLITGIKYTF